MWLIEVNTNPCLEESSAILKALLPRMIDDMLKLTVDVIFPRKRRDPVSGVKDRVYKVEGYNDYENMWELICQLIVNPPGKGQQSGPAANQGPKPFYV